MFRWYVFAMLVRMCAVTAGRMSRVAPLEISVTEYVVHKALERVRLLDVLFV